MALSAAAATFGGTSGLLWTIPWLRGGAIPPGAYADPPSIARSWGWIVAAALGACLFIAGFGPGVRFSPAAPR